MAEGKCFLVVYAIDFYATSKQFLSYAVVGMEHGLVPGVPTTVVKLIPNMC
jgi:hypothetical protein